MLPLEDASEGDYAIEKDTLVERQAFSVEVGKEENKQREFV